MVSSGWLCLAAMIVAYGIANLLQSIAAMRTQTHHSMHPSLLLRLASQRTYMYGIACQTIGFGFAFLARRHLPLFLVQASVSAGLGVMAILGVTVLKWRLPRIEILILAMLGLGIAGLVVSAKPGASRNITLVGIIALAGVLALIAVLGVFAARLRGAPGSVALGALAGLAFGAAAVDSRALANAHTWGAFVLHPLLYLLFAHALVGQLLLGMAMQRGSTTAAVAAMDAASTAPAAIIGLVLLGDQIWPGRQWLAAAGFICTLLAVLGLTRFAQPQHDTVVEEQPVSAALTGPSAAMAVIADSFTAYPRAIGRASVPYTPRHVLMIPADPYAPAEVVRRTPTGSARGTASVPIAPDPTQAVHVFTATPDEATVR